MRGTSATPQPTRCIASNGESIVAFVMKTGPDAVGPEKEFAAHGGASFTKSDAASGRGKEVAVQKHRKRLAGDSEGETIMVG